MNWLAILVGALINMAVGALWYSPVLFSKQWMQLTGKKEMGSKKDMPKMYAVTFVGALLMSYVLMHFVVATNAESWLWGIKVGFWLWLGFTAATTISDYLFVGRPLKLYAINAGYYLVVALIVGGLFGVWH
jgi:hypothetical protein